MADIHDTDYEEVRSGLPAKAETSVASTLARAEIDSQVATARQFPRPDLAFIARRITGLATMDEESAEECIYVLSRAAKKKGKGGDEQEENKPIEGPSIRLAEIAAQQYGNCRIDARVVHINRQEKYVEAEGVFHDLETNMASRATIRARISTAKGYLYSEDMIIVAGNAAAAKAKRNAILAGVPRAIYRQAYTRAREILAGDPQLLSQTRDKAIAAFRHYGVTSEQLCAALGVEAVTEMTDDHVVKMRGMFGTLKRGEETVERMFPKEQAAPHQVVENPLEDKPSEKSSDASAPADGVAEDNLD